MKTPTRCEDFDKMIFLQDPPSTVGILPNAHLWAVIFFKNFTLKLFFFC